MECALTFKMNSPCSPQVELGAGPELVVVAKVMTFDEVVGVGRFDAADVMKG